jgi:hypothetical protein
MESDTTKLSLPERASLLNVVWREREEVIDPRTELSRRSVYLLLDKSSDFEGRIDVRVREALGGDTSNADPGAEQSQRIRRWVVDSARRVSDGRAAVFATLVYPPRGHREIFWLRSSSLVPDGWFLDSITISRWVYF